MWKAALEFESIAKDIILDLSIRIVFILPSTSSSIR